MKLVIETRCCPKKSCDACRRNRGRTCICRGSHWRCLNLVMISRAAPVEIEMSLIQRQVFFQL
ncbi:hypothetical protein N431DRAFT_69797 [Stipitochalara longipes BDJ]|nr:hypothetical protein N431DRAFT_69797 [Stipitochalara longipes BDJ]